MVLVMPAHAGRGQQHCQMRVLWSQLLHAQLLTCDDDSGGIWQANIQCAVCVWPQCLQAALRARV